MSLLKSLDHYEGFSYHNNIGWRGHTGTGDDGLIDSFDQNNPTISERDLNRIQCGTGGQKMIPITRKKDNHKSRTSNQNI
jgi:hypothetical protein